jgi:hypothetical protein
MFPPAYATAVGPAPDAPYADPLMERLKTRIERDMLQINGVYNDRVATKETALRRNIEVLNKTHSNDVAEIERQRDVEIKEYMTSAETRIDLLIHTMTGSSPVPEVPMWDRVGTPFWDGMIGLLTHLKMI